MIADPLTQLMSSCSIPDHEVHYAFIQQLKYFWSRILDCLNRSQSPIFTNSSFLKSYSSLFEKALEHPHSPISKATAEFLKSNKSRLDKFSEDDTFEKFDFYSERTGVSEMNENRFVNVSTGLKRKKLKITKYVAKANGHDTCKNYGHLVGSCSKIRVVLDNGKEGREMRRPELILEMLKRKR